MIRKLILISLLLVTPALAAEPDPFFLVKNEHLGGIKLGTLQARLPVFSNCTLKKGPAELWGADGLYHQKWDYPDCGMSFDMTSDQAESTKTVFSITIKAPSRWATKRGIRIGSSEKDLRKAYAKEYNAEESQPGQVLVFGTVYGGMIVYLKGGYVKEIFLGAGAE